MRGTLASAALAAACLCTPAMAQAPMPAQMAAGQQPFAHQLPPAAFEACVGKAPGTPVLLTPPGRPPIQAACISGPTGVLFARPVRPFPFPAGGPGRTFLPAPYPWAGQTYPGQQDPAATPGY